MPCTVKIRTCLTDADFVCARKLTKEYIRWLDMDLAFQNIEAELAHFASMYGPPDGLFLLARRGGELAGGVGLRRFETHICEMKRLFVYDRFRREGIGRRLCAMLIQEALRLGYKTMRLDTFC